MFELWEGDIRTKKEITEAVISRVPVWQSVLQIDFTMPALRKQDVQAPIMAQVKIPAGRGAIFEVNYITTINSFWNLATINPLSTGQVALFFALLHLNNNSRWTEWFQAPNQVLSVLTGMSRSGILKARNELKQRGYIDFRERGTKATLYKLTIANSTQESVQDSKQKGVQIGKQVGVQDGGQAIYKEIDKDKNEEKTSPIPPVALLEEFLAAYPCSGNRYLTEAAYIDCLLTKQVTEEQLVECARNYAERCRILETEKRYVKKPENFLRDMEYCQYLSGTYICPEKSSGSRKGNKFGGFKQNEYDFESLERELLENKGESGS